MRQHIIWRGLLLAGLLTLSGCGIYASHWSKQGMSDEVRDGDFAACKQDTFDASRVLNALIPVVGWAVTNEKLSTCMRAKGYGE